MAEGSREAPHILEIVRLLGVKIGRDWRLRHDEDGWMSGVESLELENGDLNLGCD